MTVHIGQLSRIASVRGLPDRGSCAVCGGPFSVITPKTRASARAHTAIQYRRGTSRTGELDGAKEADGG
jgi:hypothetical protein